MTEFIWPSAVLAISTVFFLIFREPISTLIKRTKSIGRDGLDASHDPAAAAQIQDQQPDTVSALRKAHLAEIQRIEQRHAERYSNDIEPLKRAVMEHAQIIAALKAETCRHYDAIKTIQSFEFIKKFMAHMNIPAMP